MKNYYLIAFLLFSAFTQAQIVNIPDANFKNALINTLCVDTNGNGFGDSDADLNDDGEIQVSEAEAVIGLTVPSQSINSLEGIDSFINLTWLSCRNNILTELNVSNNTLLQILYCQNNLLNGILETTQNESLIILDASQNNLIGLDVSQNPNLEILSCYNNDITSIDVSQIVNLQALYCSSNLIQELDLSSNTQLEELNCNTNNLSFINVQNGFTSHLDVLGTLNNPDLFCIQVDDVEFANNVTYWFQDSWTNFSEDCSLGTKEFENFNFTVYPNPVTNHLNISSQFPIEKVQIYNIQGVLVKESISTNMNVSELLSGIYFVKVSSNGKTQTKKFIKN